MKSVVLEWDDVFSLCEDHVTYYTDKTKTDILTLYFSPDVKDFHYKMINDAQHNNSKSKLYYHDRYVHCVVVDNHACPSLYASPSSFGWEYAK